jgi:endo-1,4-beta-xylanase
VPALRSLAQAHGRYIGAAVAPGPLLSEPLYAETLAREFNMLTPENALKFGRTRPSRERYTFQDADAIVAFAQANRMAVRGHTLVWHEVLPRWLTAGGFTRDELLAILHEHITTVVGRYRGRIVAWDVVNEALGNDGAWRNTFWYKTIGPEYVDLAFRWAREADPQARLFYNDYGGEGLGRKSDAVYALVQGMMQRGVPIDGVGLQMHVRSDASPEPAEFAASLQRLAGLGLEVHITEMDVRIKGRVTEEELARQASICKDMLRVCFTAENCRAFVFWGFTDRHSWIPKYFPGWGAALPFDEAYRAKPAYRALMEALSTP